MIAFVIGLFAFAVFLLGIVFVVRQVLRDHQLGDLAKTVWIIVLIAAPILGLVAWFVFSFRHTPPTIGPRGQR